MCCTESNTCKRNRANEKILFYHSLTPFSCYEAISLQALPLVQPKFSIIFFKFIYKCLFLEFQCKH